MNNLTPLIIFGIHVAIYSGFSFYFASLRVTLRATAFYIYISAIVLIGGFLGSVYFLPVTESIVISGGSLAYGALMMNTVLLVILEKDMQVVHNVIRIVITVNVFKVLLFQTISLALQNPAVLNPDNTSYLLFQSSVYSVILGGLLIILELYLLLLIFERVKKRVRNIFVLSILYTMFFVAILCLDGLLFPILASGFPANNLGIVIGGVRDRLLTALAYSLPMLAFLMVFRRSLSSYARSTLDFKTFFAAPTNRLMDEIQNQKALLMESQQKFERAILEAPFPMILHAEDGEIVQLNNTWAEITGYNHQEIPSISAWTQKAYDKETAEKVQIDIRRLYKLDKKIYEGEYPIRTSTGETRVWEFSSAPLGKLPDGRRLVLSMAMDVTDRRKTEDSIRAMNLELEERVKDRTREIEERLKSESQLNLGMANLMEDLQYSNSRLEKISGRLLAVNNELETFAYTVSHDLKAPLRGIDGYSRLLLEDYKDRLDSEGQLFLQNIRDSTDRMNQLIDDLLAYSRLERRTLQVNQFDLAELINAILDANRHEVQQRGVKVEVDIPDSLILETDRENLSHALRNLIHNALKFTRNSNEPEIVIRCKKMPNGCILSVKDNGIGFDMKFHDQIFDIFHRLHHGDEYPGTGIGLAIVKKAMDRVGGRAWAESSMGNGAIFYLEISSHARNE